MASDFDAIITGSGPNGLAAAIRLQQQGISTLVVEQAAKAGGATRTEELTLEGFHHDIGSSIHPLAMDSPFFKRLQLQNYGLEWVIPDIAFAHPFADGDAYACYKDVQLTAQQLGKDADAYLNLFKRLSEDWPQLGPDILSPFSRPKYPFKMLRFGSKAFQSARYFVNHTYKEEKTKIFFYGAAAHSTLPLSNFFSAAFGQILILLAHYNGWPFPKYGAYKINEALLNHFESIGGKVLLNHHVEHLEDLPAAKAYLFDITPKQLLQIGGTKFTSQYRKKLGQYRYGPGVFKIDWALNEPIPWTNEKCRKAGTVHLGYSPQEIEVAENIVHKNKMSENPYVLMAQHSVFDDTRAPKGKHTAWAYCHVPNGSRVDATEYIERQIEKAAPGFKDCIIKRATHTTDQMEAFDPNLVGGDINGGIQDFPQLFMRPVASLSPYSTPDERVFICSSSTPPGGGVHGMCGYNAANEVIRKLFS